MAGTFSDLTCSSSGLTCSSTLDHPAEEFSGAAAHRGTTTPLLSPLPAPPGSIRHPSQVRGSNDCSPSHHVDGSMIRAYAVSSELNHQVVRHDEQIEGGEGHHEGEKCVEQRGVCKSARRQTAAGQGNYQALHRLAAHQAGAVLEADQRSDGAHPSEHPSSSA